jgi:dual specificity tyrosine-phosphorylation-regulated kinase 2/3/4
MELKGVPPKYLIEKSPRYSLFFDDDLNPRIVTNSRGKRRIPGTKLLKNVLKCDDPVFLDFIERCLEWDPEKRLTPDEALRHEWIFEVLKKAKKSFNE